MRRLYSLLGYCTVPLLLAYLWWRGGKDPQYRQHWAERFGHVGARLRCAILVHCGSVGEVLAARPLIEQLLADPRSGPLIVSCSTPTGRRQVRREFGDRLDIVYFPLDLPAATRRFLSALRPRLVILLERELWPNFLHQAQALGVPVVVANARLSEPSAASYARWQRIMQPALASLRLVCCEDETTAARFAALGVEPGRLHVTGNIKSDLRLEPALALAIEAVRNALGTRPVLTAGSTHAGEDEALIGSFVQYLKTAPDTLLILVPRHPERFEPVAQLLRAAGLRYARHSLGEVARADTQVVLGDTMGELMRWYGAADACFVGGSLVPRGGHNPLEVLALERPLIAGLFTHNFARMYATLGSEHAMSMASDAPAVFERFAELMHDRAAARAQSERGRMVYLSMAGATRNTLELLEPLAHRPVALAEPLCSRIGADTVWASPDCFSHAGSELFDPGWWQRAGGSNTLAAGRGDIRQVHDGQRHYLLRHYYRGGLMARFNRDAFLLRPLAQTRAMAEFDLLAQLRARGLPVPQACAARCRRRGLLWYCADILVALIPEARDVARTMRHERALAPAEWHALGRAIRQLHEEQVYHCDLNCHNLMLDARGKAWIVDFDKCGFRAGESWKMDNLARLLRSLRKELRLHPDLHWDEAQWKALLDGYHGAQGAKST